MTPVTPNIFLMAVTIGYILAGLWEVHNSRYWSAGIFFGWAFSNICLMRL